MNKQGLYLAFADILAFIGTYAGLRTLFKRPAIPVTAAVLLGLFLVVFWYYRLYRVEVFFNRLQYASRVMRTVLVVFVLFWGTWWFLLKTQWPEASRLLLVGLFMGFGLLYPLTLRMAIGRWLLRRTPTRYRLSTVLRDLLVKGPGRILTRLEAMDPGEPPGTMRGGLLLLEFQPSARASTRADLWREYSDFLNTAKKEALAYRATVIIFNLYNTELNHEGTIMALGDFGGLPLSGHGHKCYRRMAKPMLDRVLAMLLLPLLALLHPFVALVVRLEFGKPIIFRQIRLGRRGNPFRLFKYRTMRLVSGSNAGDVDSRHREYIATLLQEEEQARLDSGRLVSVDQRVRKMRHREEISFPGAMLRKTSLDELPQIINVLAGHMSFVGPRPALPYEVEMYPAWAGKRLDSPQGITGLWQVSGRGMMPLHTSLFLDGYYTMEYDFWLDLLISLRTLRSVFAFSRVY
ncbi:MAG TPA: sugar transferase [Candidatus Aminicenantes bacterium]|mgnify:CR=1 FL=1|nr:sugar transferase [Candidatus Aminicenantes bacterium]